MESQNSLSCAKFTPTPNYWTYYCKCKWNISSLASFRISNYSLQSLFWLLCILFVVQVEMFERRMVVGVCVCVCGKVKGWQVERPHPRLFGTVPLSHCAHGTRLPLEAFQESAYPWNRWPTPRAHLPPTSLFSSPPTFLFLLNVMFRDCSLETGELLWYRAAIFPLINWLEFY